jgi:hypothetical protein
MGRDVNPFQGVISKRTYIELLCVDKVPQKRPSMSKWLRGSHEYVDIMTLETFPFVKMPNILRGNISPLIPVGSARFPKGTRTERLIVVDLKA